MPQQCARPALTEANVRPPDTASDPRSSRLCRPRPARCHCGPRKYAGPLEPLLIAAHVCWSPALMLTKLVTRPNDSVVHVAASKLAATTAVRLTSAAWRAEHASSVTCFPAEEVVGANGSAAATCGRPACLRSRTRCGVYSACWNED
jgi:hypothetical protein